MVLNTTFNDPNIKDRINQAVGASFSFRERIKMGGIGSQRMIVQETSVDLTPYLNAVHYPTFSSIELRPHGILVHFNKGTITHAWVIPYYNLVIYRSNDIAIHSQGQFVRYRNTDRADDRFIRKLLDEKVKWTKSQNGVLPQSDQ